MHPILFRIGPFALHSYGVLVAAGYLAAITYILKHKERMKLGEEELWALIYVLFAGALLGGKLVFALANWSEGQGFWSAFSNIRYGFVFYGGLIGSLGLGLLYAAYKRLPVWRTADPFGAALPLGHAIGRLGCFAAGCCYGGPTRLPWGVRYSDAECLVETRFLGIPLHPSQLYESAGNFAIFAFIHFTFLRKQTKPGQEGRAFLAYVALYALLRFIIEFTRADDRGAFAAGLSPSQWIALGTGAAALALYWRRPGMGEIP